MVLPLLEFQVVITLNRASEVSRETLCFDSNSEARLGKVLCGCTPRGIKINI
jgi:hypothetical protein